jgi:hypothetical protein
MEILRTYPMSEKRRDVERMVRDTGLPKAAQIALLANIAVETGNSFDHKQQQRGSSAPAKGLLQFDPSGKLNDYKKYLDLNSYIDSAQNQINYFMDTIYGDSKKEIGHGNAAKLRDIIETGDYKQVTQALADMWFKPGKPHMERRMDEAYGFALQDQNETNRRTREVIPTTCGLKHHWIRAYHMIPLLTTLVQIGGNWLDNKQKVAQAKTDAEITTIKAQADRQASAQNQNYDLDRLAMENMSKSWKDEVILAVFLAPMIMAFIPGFELYALAGFGVMAQMPQWYQYTIIGMVVVIYGLRGLLEKVLAKKGF